MPKTKKHEFCLKLPKKTIMQNGTDILFKKWKDHFFNDPEWAPYLTFGLRPPTTKGNIKPIKKKIADNRKFQKKLLSLAMSYNFNLAKPTYSQYPMNVLAGTGEIDYYVAESLINTYQICLTANDRLNDDLNNTVIGNKAFRKGRIQPLEFFAKHILVGLEFFRNSDDGLNLIKQFIEPNGELQKWLEVQLKNNGSSAITKKDVLSWVGSATGESGNLKSWVHSKKQTLERIVLSKRLRKPIKNIDKYKKEITMLREEVKNQSEKIKNSDNNLEV